MTKQSIIFSLAYSDIRDGYNRNGGESDRVPVGSLIVMPGCTFYGYRGHNFDEAVRERRGPLIRADEQAFEVTGSGCGYQ